MKRVLINNMMCDNCVHFVKKALTNAGGNVTGAVVGEIFVDRLSDAQIKTAVEEDDIYKVREIREVK
jgi:copper chaperone CopZ